MNRMYLKIIMACLIAGSLCSCDDIQEENVVTPESVEGQERVLCTRSVCDSLNVLQVMQSDIDVIMLNHINLTEGRYSLNLSEEDALSIGVDEETYSRYKTMVDELNGDQEI